MSAGNWEEAESYCTRNFWEIYMEEEFYEGHTEEDLEALKTNFRLNEQEEDQLANATVEINNDTAVVTITDEGGTMDIFFILVDENWLIDDWY